VAWRVRSLRRILDLLWGQLPTAPAPAAGGGGTSSSDEEAHLKSSLALAAAWLETLAAEVKAEMQRRGSVVAVKRRGRKRKGKKASCAAAGKWGSEGASCAVGEREGT